ncbi:MAG: hypothetical protein ACI33O_02140, partial [Bhargavaea sp.]
MDENRLMGGFFVEPLTMYDPGSFPYSKSDPFTPIPGPLLQIGWPYSISGPLTPIQLALLH